MSSSNSGTVAETSAEKAVAQMAANRFQDYQQRWVPQQQMMAKTINAMYAPNSFERENLKTKGEADTGVAFDKAENQLNVRDANAGINLGSSASKLRRTGMESDKAASQGIGRSAADQMVDDSYVAGLSQLMNIGRGQEASAVKGMGESANIEAGIAANDASISAANRAGNYQAAGAGIGFGGAAARRSQLNNRPPNMTGTSNTGIGYNQTDLDTLGVGLPMGS